MKARSKGKKPTRGKARDASALVDRLLDEPPADDRELRARLAGGAKTEICGQLVDRLARGAVRGSATRGMVSTALHLLGLGGQESRLMALVRDARLPLLTRGAALEALSAWSPQLAFSALAPLPQEDSHRLMDTPLVELTLGVQEEPEQGEAIAELLAGVPAAEAESLLDGLERWRRELHVSPGLVYGQSLRRKELVALHEPMLQWIAEHGGASDVDILQELSAEAAGAGQRTQIQRYLLRLSTRLAAAGRPGEEIPRAVARISACDGQGAFILLVSFPEPEGGLWTMADLVIRAAGDVRDGFVLVERTAEEREGVEQEMQRNGTVLWTTLPPAQAATLVREGIARTREMGLPLPVDARQALFLLERVAPAPLPEVPGGAELSREEAQALLAAQDGIESWFLDAADLAEAKVGPPPWGREAKSAAGKLAKHGLQRRIMGMARHMACWCHWSGESRRASAFASLAEEAARDFASSVLLEHLTRQTERIRKQSGDGRTGWMPSSSPGARQELRRRFFAGISAQVGRDLALLDFLEAAASLVEGHLAGVPGGHRFRNEQMAGLAWPIAQAAVDWLIERLRSAAPESRMPDARLRALGFAVAQESGLSTAAATELVKRVMGGLAPFAACYCGTCPVHCLRRPEAAMVAEFSAPEHPYPLLAGSAAAPARRDR
ncbi:MAG: hypothetical protein FJ125_05675 [Deltaproteobacteria bacterium]|nr:hypothetical protein [Deltaproteobacteria bacterium]